MRHCEVSAPRSCVLASRSVVVAARQDRDRPGRSGGGSGSTKRFAPPERLLTTGPSQGQAGRHDTVYTLRLSTGMQRGAALSDPTATVLVCLVAQDGSALLHRVPRVNDPEDTEQEVRNICDSIDDREAGANCSVALQAAAAQRQKGGGPRLRFQEGAVDEISFVAPDLGPLAALIVGPEQGRWLCEEVDVSSSRTGHTARFVCREHLGEGGAEPAAYLRPVPPGAVVYGSGDSAVVVSKEQAARLYSLNLQQYNELKGQLVAATAVLVALGSALAFAAGGRDLALPFALGGASGMMYQYMLQAATDSVGAGGNPYAQPQAAGPLGTAAAARTVLANPALRLAAASAALLGGYALLQSLGGAADPDQAAPAASGLEMFQVQQIAASLLGFLCYKAAVVGVAIIPPPVGGEMGLLQADAGRGSGGSRPRRIDRRD